MGIHGVTRLCLAAVMVLAVGCKGGKIKKAQLEKDLAEEIQKTSGAAPAGLTCPGDVDKKDGTVTECSFTTATGVPAKVTVTMTGGGSYRWETARADGAPAPANGAPAFLTIPNTAVEIQAPPGWSKRQDGDWGLLTSPDKKAVLGFVAFNRPNESTRRIGQIARVLGASGVHWGSQKRGTVGPDQMPASVADGTCQFSGSPSTISYATVNPGGTTQVLVVYAMNGDVPPGTKQEGLATFTSIRRKR